MLFIAGVGCLLPGVFVLPYVFPPSSSILSASALAGFNNSVAYVCYVLALCLLAFTLAGRFSAPVAFLRVSASRPLFTVPPLPVIGVMIGYVGLFDVSYRLTHGFVFAEALYFQDAAYRVQAGATPFVDFNFFYGPLLVYPTALLSHYLGLQAGYATYYVASYLAGLYFLYILFAALIEDRRWAIGWFLLFAVGFINPITGLNYTFARFLLPVVALLAVWRADQEVTLSRSTAAVVLIALAILCSPDIAVVTLAGTCVLSAVSWSRLRSGATGTLLSCVGIPMAGVGVAGGALMLIDGTFRPLKAYFKPIVTFSAGGWSTPIDPSIPMVSLLGFSVLAAVLLWAKWRERPGWPIGALAAAYGVTFVLMQRSVFAKADVEHIAYSGLPVYLAAAGWSSSNPSDRRRAGWMAGVLLVGIVAPLQFYHAMLFMPSLVHRAIGSTGSAASGPAATKGSASKEAIQESLANAVEYFGPDRVYYMHHLEYYRLPIYLHYRLRPFLYHPSLTSVFTRQDIEDVTVDLRKSRAVVLARRSDLDVPSVQPLPTSWWYFVTSSPLPGSTVFNLTVQFQARLEEPLRQFLTTAYTRQFENGEIVGLVIQDQLALSRHAVQ